MNLFSTKQRVVKRQRRQRPQANRADYVARKEEARALVLQKLAQWNAYYGFTYHRVTIRNTRSRWGSCSSRGNLNFHYRIIDLPEELQDYIIVHELCHLQEMNHAQGFWALVAETLPQYKQLRKDLRAWRPVV